MDRSEIDENSYTFNQNLTGDRTLDVTLKEEMDQFSFGNNVGNAFTGTAALTKGSIDLDGENNDNVKTLEKATLKLSTNSIANVQSNSTIKNLTENGGTVKFAMDEISPNTKLTVTGLDVNGGVTIDLADGINGNIDTSAPSSQNIFDYSTDANNNRILSGVNLERHTLNVGLGGDFSINNRTKLFVNYDFDFGEHANTHSGQFGFVRNF